MTAIMAIKSPATALIPFKDSLIPLFCFKSCQIGYTKKIKSITGRKIATPAIRAPEKAKEKTFNEWLNHKHSTWMYYDHGQWVGSGLLMNEDIDDVFVNLGVQGKGYG